MELKLPSYPSGSLATASSNRTFMELKFNATFDKSEIKLSSNRTFMELKYSIGCLRLLLS